jgi:anti-sigma regulatory factor (Ser/Thr protein kinase)
MAMETFRQEFDGAGLTRAEFKKLFKRDLGNKLLKLKKNWAYQLAVIFGEVVLNLYDHTKDRKGVIEVRFNETEVTFEAYDFGPGYNGGSEATSLYELSEYHFRCGSSLPMSPGGNAGAGLTFIHNGLNALKSTPGIKSCDLEVTTVGHFHYKGRLTFEEHDE